LLSLTLAILRSAELGFFGLVVETFVQTPLFWGEGRVIGLFFRVLKPSEAAEPLI